MSDHRQDGSLDRRRFLAVLGAAGAYTAPMLTVLANSSTSAFAQALPAGAPESGSGSASAPAGFGSGSGSGSGSQPAGIGESGCTESGRCGGIVYASGDTFLRRAAPHTNEGANTRLRVGVAPVTRAVVKFDQYQVSSISRHGLSAQLVLHIASNWNNWGQNDNRTVEVLPLLDDFVEGNGHQSGLPGSMALRGTGAGATWFTPNDPNVADAGGRRATTVWNGAAHRLGNRTARRVVHVNQMVDVDVAWDVTADVMAGYTGWLIRVTDERRGDGDNDDEGGRDEQRPLGNDQNFGGTVEYYSREGAAALGNPNLGPRLYIG